MQVETVINYKLLFDVIHQVINIHKSDAIKIYLSFHDWGWVELREIAFNDRASQWIGSRFFGYNSPAAIARELFKPSTDAARLLGSIKKHVLIWVRGSSGRGSQSGGVFAFLTNFEGPWTLIQ